MPRGLFLSFLLCTLAAFSSAQLPPIKTDPLAKSISGSIAACSETEASSCAAAVAKIIPLVLGPSPMEENLRRLTDEVGGRVTGSPEMAKAVEWAVAAFRAAGIEVHTEKYRLPLTWSEGNTHLELLGPGAFLVHIVSVGWSPATPAEGIEAGVVDVGKGSADDFARAGASIKGSILLVSTDLGTTWADLFSEYEQPPPVIERAKEGGARAILWMGARARMLMYRHTNGGDGQLEAMPQAILAREDAMRLSRDVAAYAGKVRESVILGAHLDSWELGTGALDNGCNAAMVIEAARAIKASGLVPRRSIRFVLFSGEEQGMLGSAAYARSHRAELDKVRAVVIFDSGIGRVSGYQLSGRRDIQDAVHEVLRPFDSWGANNSTLDGGTDNWDFLLEGVPTLVANQEEANYLPNYHAASDTFDKVDLRELKLNTALAAGTTWGIADRDQPIGKRLSRTEIEQQLKESGLDEKMKMEGYWEPWQKGTRGRQQ